MCSPRTCCASGASIPRAISTTRSAEGEEVPENAAPAPSDEKRDEALVRARTICKQENEEVLAAGGLCVIGTERHESRRIDNQLRGLWDARRPGNDAASPLASKTTFALFGIIVWIPSPA